MRLFFIGLAMGIADLIPGISGGTVAFMCGIYESLLESIKTLQFHSLKKIAWPFLLPLFGGIVTSIALFSKVVYFLFIHFRFPLFGFFFGVIAASTLLCGREAKMAKPTHYIACIAGAAIALFLTSLPAHLIFGSGFWGIMFAGMLGTAAMLLPGISGSFVLQVIGVYPLILYALNTPTTPASFKLLSAMGIGIALGFILFSRSISFLLKHFKQITLSILVGFMAGGLKGLWPFTATHILIPLTTLILGFFAIIILNFKVIRAHSLRAPRSLR